MKGKTEGLYLRNEVGRTVDHSIQYIEYQSVGFFVGIGSPQPLPRKPVWLPSGTQAGSQNRLRGRGSGEPNSDDGTETLVLYVLYNIIPIRRDMWRGEQLIRATLDTWFGTADFYLGNVAGEQLRGEQL